jgi:hypothetical protein
VIGKASKKVGELPKIVGYGRVRNFGMRKGVVIDSVSVAQAVDAALAEAEKVGGVSVEGATFSVSGVSLKSVYSKGSVAIAAEQVISIKDADQAVEVASAVQLPNNQRVIELVTGGFCLDGKEKTQDPTGMVASKLEAEVVVLSASEIHLRSLEKAINTANVNCDGTLPGRGIHLMYLQSDQQEWHVPCDACNTFSVLDFFRDVYADGLPYEEWQHRPQEVLRQAKMTTHCPQCKAELNRFHSGSRWIARHPEITGIRGYHVPSLCFPMIDLNEFAVNAVSTNPTAIEEFFRSDLGVPYEKSGSQITNGILDALSDEMPLPPFRSTVMGVDVGSRWHYRITSIASDGKRYVPAMGRRQQPIYQHH